MKKLLLVLTTFSFHMAEKSAHADIKRTDSKNLMKPNSSSPNIESFKGPVTRVSFDKTPTKDGGFIPVVNVDIGSDSDYMTLKFTGQDYYLGTTLVSAIGHQMNVVAEKRKNASDPERVSFAIEKQK